MVIVTYIIANILLTDKIDRYNAECYEDQTDVYTEKLYI